MTTERKIMVSVRLPAALVARADYVARNHDGDIRSRSAALYAALDDWLPKQEQRLEQLLGSSTKKVRPQA